MLKGVEQPVRIHAVGEDERLARREPLENDKVRSLRRQGRRRLLFAGAAAATAVALPLGYWAWREDAVQRWQSQWLVIADWDAGGADSDLANVLATAFRI